MTVEFLQLSPIALLKRCVNCRTGSWRDCAPARLGATVIALGFEHGAKNAQTSDNFIANLKVWAPRLGRHSLPFE